MGGLTSLNKGKRGEREVIKLLQPIVDKVYREVGWEIPKLQRNTMQSDAGGFDIAGLEWLALEVKLHAAANHSKIESWWQQTVRQAWGGQDGDGWQVLGGKQTQVPVLIWRVDKGQWNVVTMVSIPITTRIRVKARATLSVHDWLVWFENRLRAQVQAIANGIDDKMAPPPPPGW